VTAIHGTAAKGFEGVRKAFELGQARDAGGAQLCIYHNGEKVVDLWGGNNGDHPYTEDTLAILMSCSKGVTATLAHILVDRGLLDLATSVANYWPEFAQNGKGTITTAQLLSHSAGLASFDPETGFRVEEMVDWDRCTGLLAAMAPLWEPGTAYAYHALTYGFLVGEVIRRITGKRIGQVLQDEIAAPLGVDLWFGLPEDEEHRVARHFYPPKHFDPAMLVARQAELGVDMSTQLARAMAAQTMRTFTDFDVLNTRAAHAAEVPAGGGIGNARAIAKMYAATIGEVDGVRLYSKSTMEKARVWQTQGLGAPGDYAKLPVRDPLRLALGYELANPVAPKLGEGSFGHSGAGGRLGYAHPESGVAVGYVCNNMVWDSIKPDPRWLPWTQALKDMLKI
jgi:CubicO group peptidase (beta-lactamase class C family)